MPPSSLTTRCVHCHTVFRVTAAQLQIHGGQVRCGRCMQTFNALAALAPEAAAPVEESLPFAATATAAVATAPSEPGPSAPEPPAPSSAAVAEPPMPVAAEAVAEVLQELLPDPPSVAVEIPASAAQAETAVVSDAAVSPLPPVEAADADNPFVQTPEEEQPAPPRRRLFAAASALLVLALLAQAVFFYRGEIAARHPLARQWLASACAEAGCTVTLPQRPQSILIEASDLQVADPANPNRIQLTATLRNHAGHDVGYPALDLVLTNVNDHTLARRIFLPEEYLGTGRDIRAGIAANAEVTVRLALETGGLGAAGFRLAVLPAPSR
jgi:predicted Zn finger-like uncharacterized protein